MTWHFVRFSAIRALEGVRWAEIDSWWINLKRGVPPDGVRGARRESVQHDHPGCSDQGFHDAKLSALAARLPAELHAAGSGARSTAKGAGSVVGRLLVFPRISHVAHPIFFSIHCADPARHREPRTAAHSTRVNARRHAAGAHGERNGSGYRGLDNAADCDDEPAS